MDHYTFWGVNPAEGLHLDTFSDPYGIIVLVILCIIWICQRQIPRRYLNRGRHDLTSFPTPLPWYSLETLWLRVWTFTISFKILIKIHKFTNLIFLCFWMQGRWRRVCQVCRSTPNILLLAKSETTFNQKKIWWIYCGHIQCSIDSTTPGMDLILRLQILQVGSISSIESLLLTL